MTVEAFGLQFEEYNRVEHTKLLPLIARKLSMIDRAEAISMSGDSVLTAIDQSLANAWDSHSFIVYLDGYPEGCFGLCKAMEPGGTNRLLLVPWLLMSDRIRSKPMALHRLAKKIVDTWATLGDLCNFVSIENQAAIRWLTRLGFQVDYSKTYTFYGTMKFVIFKKRRVEHQCAQAQS